MKKSVLLFGCLILCLQAQAQTANEDSIVVNRPEKVSIITNDKQQTIEIIGSEENPNYHFSRTTDWNNQSLSVTKENKSDWDFRIPFTKESKRNKRHSKSAFEIGGIALGWNKALNGPSNMNVNMGASYEIMADHLLNYVYYPQRNGHSFQIGFGISWKNFRMNGRNRFIKEGDRITIGKYPEGADIEFSRLKIFSWTLPVMYGYEFGKDLSVKVGPVLQFNTYGSLKTKYKEASGEKIKIVDKNIHQNPVTIHLQGQINWKAIGLYVKYSPCHVLNTDFGPEFESLSTGITLFY